MPKLIGIAGRAGAGKDTVADYLWENYGFLKMSFADPLKRAASAMFGITLEAFYDRDLKEQVVEFWGMSPRTMAQLLGSDAVKPVFGEDLWIKRFMVSYACVAKTDHVVIPDVRFEPEAQFIRDMGGTIVHLQRPGLSLEGAAAAHYSENGIAHVQGDTILTNMGTLENLYSQVDMMLHQVAPNER